MDKNLQIVHPEDADASVMTIDQAAAGLKQLQRFVKSQMKIDIDFGIIPGTKKPGLWKPGAEKLLKFHGYSCIMQKTAGTITDWKNAFFHFEYRAEIFTRDERLIAACEGSCNSKESKYRWNWLTENRIPKGYNPADLETKTIPTRNGDLKLYRIDNDDVCSQVNTFQKMAQKRAMLGATLLACRASDIFSYDLETPDEPRADPGRYQKQADSFSQQLSSKTAKATISDKQRKMLFAKCKAAGISTDAFAAWMYEHLSYTVDDKDGEAHSSLILRGDCQKAVDWIESGGN